MSGAIGARLVFGCVLLWTGVQVHNNVGRCIDCAFFRNAYDARLVMEQLVEKTRTATTRREVAELLQQHLNDALRPTSVVGVSGIAGGTPLGCQRCCACDRTGTLHVGAVSG